MALDGCERQLISRHARRAYRDDIHLTLQFLGNVPEQLIPEIETRAASVVAPEVKLRLTRLGCWSKPQVAWCAPDETPAALRILVRNLGGVMSEIGYPPEQRVFHPHVTLARKIRAMPESRLATPIAWTSREFAVVESLATAKPPRYRVMAKWALQAEDSIIGE